MADDIQMRHALFQEATPDFRDVLMRDARPLRLKRRQVFMLAGEPADRFFLVQYGWIKLFRETLDGSEAVIDILNAGKLIGETALFHDDSYSYSAEAAEDAMLLSMPLAPMKREIEINPKFAITLLHTMARYRREQDQEIEHRTLQNAPQRIGCFLLRLIGRDHGGPAVIDLPYDKTLVASRLGMKPETFSRALGKLKAEIDMSVKGSTIEIADSHALVEYCCNVCSNEFPCADITKTIELR